MQTQFRRTRSIIAEAFGKKPDDPTVMECAKQVVEFLTGKEIPKKDPIAGWLRMDAEHEAALRETIEILQTFERELRRKDDLASQADWQDFARGFVRKELAEGHDYHVFLTWYRQDPERMNWAWKETPTRIRSRWLMAFEQSTQKLPSGV